MGSYYDMYLICLAVIVTSLTCTVGQLTCYNYDPLSINGTQPSSELRCPDRCNCTYCAVEGQPFLEYTHDVDCSDLYLKTIPSMGSVPTDARFYYLRVNNIASLKNNSFKTSPALEQLRLGENRFTYKTIELDAFRGLKNLTYLSLDNNVYLSHLLTHWFVHLVSLETLHIQNCGISTLKSEVFKHSNNLKKIDLTGNAIMSFPATVFQNLPSLNNLYISDNHLRNIPPGAFVGSSNLQIIALNNNSLSTISESSGLQNLGQLQTVSISYNTLSCDCNLVWFRNWIDKTNITFEDIARTKCFNPSSKTYHMLMDFDTDTLQCNKRIPVSSIVSAPTAVFAIAIIGFLLYYFRYDLRYLNQRRRLRKQYQKLENQGPPPINGENIRYDAFVSYNSKDQQWILSVLQPSLESQRNFKLCVDYRDFIPGEAVVINIADAVKYSRKVLLVVSKNFAKSEWCYFELEMARMRMFDNHEDMLVVVLLEKVSSKDMPILLHKILTKKTYIEWKEHPEGQALFWAKLEAALLSPNCSRDRLLDNHRDENGQKTQLS